MVIDSSDATRFAFKNPESKHDRVILVEGKRFYCRASYLSSWSGYFTSLFNADFAEKTQKEIELRKIPVDDFQLFMEISHTGKKIETIDECIRLLSIEQYLLSPGIQVQCSCFLLARKDVELKEILYIGNEYMIMPLVEYFFKSIGSNQELRKFIEENNDLVLSLSPSVRALIDKRI